MNYTNSLETILQQLDLENSESEIRSILRSLAYNEESLFGTGAPRTIEDKLNDLRDRYNAGYGASTMNLYPSEISGSCHSFCLAIASKKFENPRKGLQSGFRGIMLEMAAYWISCAGINRETLILTSTWDNKIFEEQYKKIIDAYCGVKGSKVYIVEVGPSGFFLRYPY